MLRPATVALVSPLLVLAALRAPAAPDAPDALEWRAVGRASALRWSAPGGDPVASYEVRGSELPIDETTFAAASPLAFFPTGTPRPPGVLEFRELEEVEVDEDEEEPKVLETALYFAVRALDQGGAPGPVAATGGFELSRVRAKPDRTGRTKLVLKGRFAVARKVLDVASGDLRIRLVQNDVTLLDETVPAAAFPPSGQPIRVRDAQGPLRLVTVENDTFALLTVKTAPLDVVLDPGGVTMLVDLGARPFAATGTLREKGRKLVHP